MDAPPPYSETDPSETHSTTGTTTNTSNSRTGILAIPSDRFIHSRAPHPTLSAGSSVDDTVYTPVYSPSHSSHALTDQDHVASSSAAAYFESRPVTNRNTGSPIAHTIVVEANTKPSDIPFPSSFQAHGVLEADWLTFVNFVLSDYILASSDHSRRKSGEESLEDGVQRLGLDEKLRPDTGTAERRSISVPPRDKVNTTISEWNEGFFQPRGLQVTLLTTDRESPPIETAESAQPRETPSHIPGAWIPYDHEIIGESSAAGRRRGFFGGFKGFQSGSHGKFRMGPIVADNEGFRMGNMFIADQKGLRVGGSKGFVADDSGVSMGGRSFFRRESTDPERGRGRSLGRRRKSNRSSSTSSASSTTSDASSDTESSVGSLPDYDDLRDPQLLAAKQTLERWLHQSDQPLTKSSVAQLRSEIRSSTGTPSHQSDQDVVVLRREVKLLLKEFRESKKRQKREQRQARKERRALRRAVRSERRTARREARRLRRAGRGGCKGKEPSRRAPWMASRSTIDLEQPPPPMPPRPFTEFAAPGFPFTRAVSAPFIHPSTPLSPSGPPIPGLAVLHSTWPYARNSPYSPGAISTPPLPGAFPSVVTASSESLYAQVKEMEELARRREEQAMHFRTEATRRDLSEKERLKRLDQAERLEEEAEKWGVEAERLRAEAESLDGELARDLEESSRANEGVGGNGDGGGGGDGPAREARSEQLQGITPGFRY